MSTPDFTDTAYVAPLITAGKSLNAAEAIARSSDEYKMELALLEKQFQHAERARAQWTATQATFEASRSLLSLNKELMRQIPE